MTFGSMYIKMPFIVNKMDQQYDGSQVDTDHSNC